MDQDTRPLGVAVIGAGMAGRAHAQGYRTATTLYGAGLPPVRLAAVADAHRPFADDAARRYGYDRAVTSWQEVAEDPAVDVVSVVVANSLHREVVEGLLAAGKHVLCEKPLAPSLEDARAMVAAAERAAADGQVTGTGFTFRRSPAIAAVADRVHGGDLGDPRSVSLHYWCDYALDPRAPMSWRYRGGPGSGALADIGSHAVDVAEVLLGPVRSVAGASMSTFTTERPLPVGAVVGHAGAQVSDETAPVENEDVVTFTATFDGGVVGTFSVSRVAHGLPNGLGFEVFGSRGAAMFDLGRPAEITYSDGSAPAGTGGYRQVLLGPDHPYVRGGLAMDFPSVGHGQNEFFAYQCRAFLEQVTAARGGTVEAALPPVPSLAHGLHNLEVLDAVTRSAAADGARTQVAPGA